MAKKLFIGNLSYSVSENDLKTLFSEAGEVVSVAIPTDRMTGRPRGFAFVEMATEDEAAKAIDLFNGKEVEGRALAVNEARPMENRER